MLTGLNVKVLKMYFLNFAGSGSDDLPQYWESMVDPVSNKVVPLRVVDLATSSKGYQFVLAEFNKTMTRGRNYTSIVKIQCVQNPGLYGQYTSKKKYLDSRNPSSVQNERWLFHGTKEGTISHINRTNFNRSLSGQNGMHHVHLLGIFYFILFCFRYALWPRLLLCS